MTASTAEELLDIKGLRARFARYTRAAFALLPPLQEPRLLDIGCGPGTSMLELARLSDARFVGIDIDAAALRSLRQRIVSERLEDRITVVETSLLGVDLPDAGFDVLWEEGVVHLLDVTAGLEECARLVKPGGHFISCETVLWHAENAHHFDAAGFRVVDRVIWPSGCWWSEYYAPLEERVARLRGSAETVADPDSLDRYENEIRMVKPAPQRFDCQHLLMQSA